MKGMKYSFDTQCLWLAEHFLPADASEQRKNDLAQLFQNCAEDFCEMYPNSARGGS